MNIEDVLNLIKQEIESIDPVPKEYLKSSGSDNGFEKLVPKIAKEISKSIQSTDVLTIILPKSKHHFPDLALVLNNQKYGLELKSRKDGTWTTNGNSVFESITDSDYEEIFLMFGSKIPNQEKISVRFAPYWKVTKSITVTHSPRFTINISDKHLNSPDSVFNSKLEYDELRSLDEEGKIKFLQNYLSKSSNGLKWYVHQNELISPIFLGDLSIYERNIKLAELLILFPKDLIGKKPNNYKRAASHLMNVHFTYSSNLRDNFSASGFFIHKGESFSRIYEKYKESASTIIDLLADASDDFKDLARKIWQQDGLLNHPTNNILDDFKFVINSASQNDEKLIQSLSNIAYNDFSDFVFN